MKVAQSIKTRNATDSFFAGEFVRYKYSGVTNLYEVLQTTAIGDTPISAPTKFGLFWATSVDRTTNIPDNSTINILQITLNPNEAAAFKLYYTCFANDAAWSVTIHQGIAMVAAARNWAGTYVCTALDFADETAGITSAWGWANYADTRGWVGGASAIVTFKWDVQNYTPTSHNMKFSVATNNKIDNTFLVL